MNNNIKAKDDVELSMPLNPIYIGTARTTASSVAEKMNFSNFKVEEIKTAVSETVSFLIDSLDNTSKNTSNFKITFKPSKSNLNVEFKTDSNLQTKENDGALSLKLVESCMDDVSIKQNPDSSFFISLKKNI